LPDSQSSRNLIVDSSGMRCRGFAAEDFDAEDFDADR
jgi:hypothetical protein